MIHSCGWVCTPVIRQAGSPKPSIRLSRAARHLRPLGQSLTWLPPTSGSHRLISFRVSVAPLVGMACRRYGYVRCGAAGMYHEALASAQSAFELKESLLGADHKDTVAARVNLNRGAIRAVVGCGEGHVGRASPLCDPLACSSTETGSDRGCGSCRQPKHKSARHFGGRVHRPPCPARRCGQQLRGPDGQENRGASGDRPAQFHLR